MHTRCKKQILRMEKEIQSPEVLRRQNHRRVDDGLEELGKSIKYNGKLGGLCILSLRSLN